MRFDSLWPEGPGFILSEKAFAPGTDSLLLAAFADMGKVGVCLDAGCGSGLISILLAVKNPNARIDAIDIDEDAANICQENIELNGLGGRIRAICGDLRKYREISVTGNMGGRYDLVIANPPYFPVGRGGESSAEQRAASRDERLLPLSELCAAAAYYCRFGGSFALVHRPERLSEICCVMTASGIEPKRLRIISGKPGSTPNLVLIEGRRGGKPGLKIESVLSIKNADGSDSTIMREIYDGGLFMRGEHL